MPGKNGEFRSMNIENPNVLTIDLELRRAIIWKN